MMLRNWIASMISLVAAPLSAQAPRPLPNGIEAANGKRPCA